MAEEEIKKTEAVEAPAEATNAEATEEAPKAE